MTLTCQDWRAKAPERRYSAEIAWAGAALLGEGATRDYEGSLNAFTTYTAI